MKDEFLDRHPKKELLTANEIKQDILAVIRETADTLLIDYLAYFIILLLITVFSSFLYRWIWIAPLICAVFVLVLYFYKANRCTQEKTALANAAYTVDVQKLDSIRTETQARRGAGLQKYSYEETEFLCFSVGEWRIPDKNYQWSDLYGMSRQGIVNTAITGDEFYVIISAKTHEILCAYPCKFFTYQETEIITSPTERSLSP